jgi:hypothetical protein
VLVDDEVLVAPDVDALRVKPNAKRFRRTACCVRGGLSLAAAGGEGAADGDGRGEQGAKIHARYDAAETSTFRFGADHGLVAGSHGSAGPYQSVPSSRLGGFGADAEICSSL